MLIDFHTHSTASDGALHPHELIDRAFERGVTALALTDHDTVRGYSIGREAEHVTAGRLRLIPGVELSCRWSGVTIHVVGLGMNCADADFAAGLAHMDGARLQRADKIARRLAGKNMPDALAGALAEAGDSQLGRPHFARWMVKQGHVADHSEAFDRFLGQGKIGDVKAFWPPLAEVVNWIVRSGGVAVLAHPYKYRLTGMKLRRLIIDFRSAGGGALEIYSGRQTPEQSTQLRRYAREFELEVSMGSDFHRDGPFTAEVGVEPRDLAGLLPVWRRWTDVSAEASQ